MISVQVWDKSNIQAVDKAIREANLGVNPIVDGAVIRLPMPAPTAERRQELIKQAHKYAENHRIAVRNVRRDGMELLKKLEKDGKMSEDEHHKNSAKVQELTDKLIKEIDQTCRRRKRRSRRSDLSHAFASRARHELQSATTLRPEPYDCVQDRLFSP